MAAKAGDADIGVTWGRLSYQDKADTGPGLMPVPQPVDWTNFYSLVVIKLRCKEIFMAGNPLINS